MSVNHSGNHAQEFSSFVEESRRRRLFEDVRIICEDSVVLWGHAAVLSSVSPFLKDVLLSESRVSSSGEDPLSLFFPDVKSAHMRKALEGLYRGSVSLQGGHLEPILDILRTLHVPTPLTEPVKDRHGSGGQALFVQALGEESKLHKCVMCSKTFLHAQNLKIHLQSHLGLQVHLNKCTSCKRVFGRNLEYELHMNSHRYWQKLKTRLSKASSHSRSSSKFRKAIVKRSVRLLLRNHRRNNIPVRDSPLPAKDSQVPNVPSSSFSVGAKASETKKLKLKIKNSPLKNTSDPSSQSDSTWCTICRRFYADLRGLKKHYSRVHTSDSPLELRNKPSGKRNGEPLIRRSPLSNRDIDLKCPTCDKVFVAYSIFQRHLKTSQHGNASPSPRENRPPPHMNKILQPTILVRGKETPKYECHLCKQVFLRVKDLAKHRAKMCSAWVN